MTDEMRADFLTFWSAYGRDIRKADASHEYVKARADGVEQQVLLDAARTYALSQPQKWRRDAVNWLKSAQWLDSPVEARKRAGPLDWLAEMNGGVIPGIYQGPIPMPGAPAADDPFTIDGEFSAAWTNE